MFRPTLFTLVLAPLAVLAQTIVNGQIFTNGLAIVDVRAHAASVPEIVLSDLL
jgi:hypothetical protein